MRLGCVVDTAGSLGFGSSWSDVRSQIRVHTACLADDSLRQDDRSAEVAEWGDGLSEVEGGRAMKGISSYRNRFPLVPCKIKFKAAL